MKNNQNGEENEPGNGENVVIEDVYQSNKDDDLPERREGERIGGSERSQIARKLGSCKENTCEDGTTSDETEGKEVTENMKPLKWISIKREVQKGAIQSVYR